ncbi:hypothetical protein Corgl_1267 [Coriobacterium glomerans PW2]|uniref:Uncharacterized protein n=1 Tax=Coriobacterium glomerans (strain ATCC 49209 / DSM 20642 / JCM 10262 / PW2) TaxID=700015 RepID=F2N8I5_CORGP|nr:hypothetical protein Corgl_1267 [Coriobacterium glomerans PW2]
MGPNLAANSMCPLLGCTFIAVVSAIDECQHSSATLGGSHSISGCARLRDRLAATVVSQAPHVESVAL